MTRARHAFRFAPEGMLFASHLDRQSVTQAYITASEKIQYCRADRQNTILFDQNNKADRILFEQITRSLWS